MHGIPMGYVNKKVACLLGDFLRQFISNDSTGNDVVGGLLCKLELLWMSSFLQTW